MRDSLKIAGAFIGIIVGAGFASGAELLQYFIHFGLWGLLGMALSAVLFTFFGMVLAKLGRRLNAVSHKVVVHAICGPYLGAVIDALITFFMFGVAIVMLAGVGALLEQQYDIPATVGSLAATVLVVAIVCLDAQKVVFAVGAATPFLMVAALGLSGYAFITQEASLATMSQFATPAKAAAPNWLVGSLLYVSYNLVASAPFMVIMGGLARREKIAVWGGILGGAGVGMLMLALGVGLLSRMNTVSELPLPILGIANEVSPLLGTFMSIIIFVMMLNTAVGMFYAFLVRVLPVNTPLFRIGALVSGMLGFVGSLIGFITLVSKGYAILGYIGFTLMAAILLACFRMNRIGTGDAPDQSVSRL